MVCQYIYFPTLIKKGTFTYSDSNPGDSRSPKMWRCCSQITSDYMKFYIYLYALYLPRPPPLPPHTSSAPCFSGSGPYRHPRYSYTWYTGVSQNNFLWQKYLASNFWKISPICFFSAALRPYIFATPFAKKCASFSHQSLTREFFSRSLFRYSFSPFLNKCQLFMLKDFWNLPVNPVWRVPGFMKGGKGR